jgi:hypothetical protein
LCSIAIEGHNAFHFGCEERSDGGVEEDVHGIILSGVRPIVAHCVAFGIGTGLVWLGRLGLRRLCASGMYISIPSGKILAQMVECNEKCTVKLDVLSCLGNSFSQATGRASLSSIRDVWTQFTISRLSRVKY